MSFSKLIQIMREEGSAFNPYIVFGGEVVSVSPMKIRTNEIELDKDELKIATSAKSGLVMGDEVLLIKQGAFFIIVAKVEGVT